jgi:hypothetical protein
MVEAKQKPPGGCGCSLHRDRHAPVHQTVEDNILLHTGILEIMVTPHLEHAIRSLGRQ